MRVRTLLFLFLLVNIVDAGAQNPATFFNIPNRNISLPCGSSCATITATVPHIKRSNNYVVESMAYLPFAYSSAGGTEVTAIYQDDTWSPKIPIGFPFCFYGISYPTLLMGSNANITFDTTRAGTGSGYSISATTGAIPNTAYAPAMIFGPYHDINPNATSNPAPTNRKIEYRVEGTAPTRRFIASYNDVAYFGTQCGSFKATHQMVLYEATGVIEVYIKDKPSCTDWNSGLTILGVQDHTRTQAVAAPGKNATVWGSTGMNEAYRFTPSSGTSAFKRAELVVNGTVVALADTASTGLTGLNLNFNNVCPGADSTAYVLRVVYENCSGGVSSEVAYTDTVRVKKLTPTINVTSTIASCTVGGTITANVTGGTAPLSYSLNGGAYQTSNTFSNLQPGNYIVTLKDNLNCTLNRPITVGLNNNLAIGTASDTTICIGATFNGNATANLPGANYTWSPSQGLSSATAQNPVVAGINSGTTRYVVTASLGYCERRDTLNVTTFPAPQVNAGPDIAIINGDVIQLQATAVAGTYVWTPSTGLSATNILNPMANPSATTTYRIELTTPQGCKSSDEVTITVLECINPMEAFSPNGDGINDLWMVTNTQCLRQARVQVYNRYGSPVYESNDYKNNWNGTYNGKPLPDGTYYFVITYQLINGKNQFKKGNVTILR